MEKVKLGISSCLLGEKVRYDGGHKLDHFLKDTLGEYVEWVPVCPEVEYGLHVPREAMHLVKTAVGTRLVTYRTAIDHTDGMINWAAKRLDALGQEDLCGFVFKSKSPSSGMRGVKIYNPSGVTTTTGVGIFAKEFMDRFPLVPVEDDGRLRNPALRENFIERIFVFKGWKEMLGKGSHVNDLISFHTDHKLLILAHSPKHYAALGKLVAGANKENRELLFGHYFETLMEAMKLTATTKKNTNVLQHIAGYFKRNLSSEEKQELGEIIDTYHRGLVPLIVPMVIIKHYAKKYDQKYLMRQVYLNPHPLELMLRNHV